LREISGPRTSVFPQPGVSRIDVPAGIIWRKQLYSWRSEPLDDDDDLDEEHPR